GLLAVVLLIGAAAGGVVAAIFGGGDPAAAALACTATVTNPGATPAGLSAEQTRNAAVIIGVGQRMGIPVRGWVIAIAAALHEARATEIVAAYTGGAVCDGGDGTTGAGLALPPGFRLPPGTPPQVVIVIGWALAQLGTPYSFGGDCTAAHSGDSARECDCSSLVMGAYRAAG